MIFFLIKMSLLEVNKSFRSVAQYSKAKTDGLYERQSWHDFSQLYENDSSYMLIDSLLCILGQN